MSYYRQMRRQARLARRIGLQPMMMINTGDGFPETVGVVLLRGVWRYRSELAPVGVVAGLVAAAWWLHHTRPHWWFPVAVLAGVAAWAVALFGARWRLPTLPERVYAAGTIYAGGIWLSVAIAIGPFSRPLLQAGIIGGRPASWISGNRWRSCCWGSCRGFPTRTNRARSSRGSWMRWCRVVSACTARSASSSRAWTSWSPAWCRYTGGGPESGTSAAAGTWPFTPESAGNRNRVAAMRSR